MLFQILGVITAYLLGSIPTSVWVSRYIYGIDIRSQGSGNAGATNTIRVLGLKAGIPVLLFDVFKGWLAVYLARWWVGDSLPADRFVIYQIVLGVAAVLGHVYPVFAGFKGGKGVATLVGVVIALYPQAFLVILGIFVLTMVITRTVSISSMVSAILFPFVTILLFNERSLPLVLLAIFIAVFVPYTHKANIKRILNGTEKKFDFGKNRINK